mmetsp:Transcript_63274/g.74833  ORF Transcript_63274/g.74833 Transcript_63274/m.74833 type:complete len:105 (-) Transcript_63274:410-724(-)
MTQHAHHPVTPRARQHQSVLMGRERDAVHGTGMEVRPGLERDPIAGGAFAVDENGAGEGAGGEEGAELGVRPGDFPDGAGGVGLEGGGVGVAGSGDVEDFYGSV